MANISLPSPVHYPTGMPWVPVLDCICPEENLFCFRPANWSKPIECVHEGIKDISKHLATPPAAFHHQAQFLAPVYILLFVLLVLQLWALCRPSNVRDVPNEPGAANGLWTRLGNCLGRCPRRRRPRGNAAAEGEVNEVMEMLGHRISMPRVNWPANVVQQQPANPMGIPDPENPGMYVIIYNGVDLTEAH